LTSKQLEITYAKS